MDDQLRKNLLKIIEISNVNAEDKYSLSARVPLLLNLKEAYELKGELELHQRALQLQLHRLFVRLLVVPVVEAAERPTHRACYEHQRFFGLK